MLGSVGANALSGVIAEVIDRLRAKGMVADRETVEHALADRIERVLTGGSQSSMKLRLEIAAALEHLDCAAVVVEAAVSTADEQVVDTTTVALSRLVVQFGEFDFILQSLSAKIDHLSGLINHQGALQRATLHRDQQVSLELRLIRRGFLAAPRGEPELSANSRQASEDAPYRGLFSLVGAGFLPAVALGDWDQVLLIGHVG